MTALAARARARALARALALVSVVALGAAPAWGQGAPEPEKDGEQAPAPVDLLALVPQTVPPGFTPLADQPGRLGALDAAAAAAVLDQSGRVTATMLQDAGFANAYSKAWSKGDTGDVIITVLLEFKAQRDAEAFLRGFLQGRRQTTEPFPIPGVPEAAGFRRGPDTPDRTMPAQREVVLQRGRVMAIVVVAGFQAYPAVEPAVTMAEAQRATMAGLPVDRPARRGNEGTAPRVLAMVLFVSVASWLARVLKANPTPFRPRAA